MSQTLAELLLFVSVATNCGSVDIYCWGASEGYE
jgi:hypothetical protein